MLVFCLGHVWLAQKYCFKYLFAKLRGRKKVWKIKSLTVIFDFKMSKWCHGHPYPCHVSFPFSFPEIMSVSISVAVHVIVHVIVHIRCHVCYIVFMSLSLSGSHDSSIHSSMSCNPCLYPCPAIHVRIPVLQSTSVPCPAIHVCVRVRVHVHGLGKVGEDTVT